MSKAKKKSVAKSTRQKAVAKSRKAQNRAKITLPAAETRPKSGRKLPTLQPLRFRLSGLSRRSVVALIFLALAASSTVVLANWPTAVANTAPATPQNLKREFAAISQSARSFIQQEQRAHTTIVSPTTIQNRVNTIEININLGRTNTAVTEIQALKAHLLTWTSQLSQIVRETVSNNPTPAPSGGSLFIPIVLYHYPPDNLAQQFQYLIDHGYTSIDPDQVAAAVNGTGTLPAKPVMLTFDDGYSNQMAAFHLLKQFNLKATFYIINGGAESKWCIGAGRRYHDPLQPMSGCGDSYLNWNEVRQLDRSGLVTIGGHTLDHENLASLSAAQQQREIVDSKIQTEQELGHPIDAFAYPYGDFNAITIQIVAQAGYTTAVTTMPGEYQKPNEPFTLVRIRDTLSLP